MSHIELEKQLNQRLKKKRIILGIISGVLFIIIMAFLSAYDASKVVEEITIGSFTYEEVSYDYNYMFGVLFGTMLFIPTLLIFITDIIFSGVTTVEVNGYYVSFYCGQVHRNLYVNGEYREGALPGNYYLETKLPGKENIIISK